MTQPHPWGASHTAAGTVTTGKGNCYCRKLDDFPRLAGHQGWGVTPAGGRGVDLRLGDSQSRDLKFSEEAFAGPFSQVAAASVRVNSDLV